MRLIPCVALGGLWCAIATTDAHAQARAADPITTLRISLDVPEERAPDWLCILTTVECHPATNCPDAANLPQFVSLLKKRGRKHYGFSSPPPSIDKLPPRVGAALRALARPTGPDQTCDREHPEACPPCSREDTGACAPELDLRPLDQAGVTAAGRTKLRGQIVCGGPQSAAGAAGDDDFSGKPVLAGSFTNRRVAFVALMFRDQIWDGAGIQAVKRVGTRATITFDRPILSSRIRFLQVLGGDYTASLSSELEIDQRVTLALRPRCTHVVAEVPAHTATAPIASISLAINSLGASEHGDPGPPRAPDLLTCRPDHADARTIPLELPLTSPSDEKRLIVTYGTPQATTSDVRWVGAAPPTPLKLGVRSIQFRWQRPIGCLAERWGEPTPAPKPVQWTASCPKATLSGLPPCEVISHEPPAGGAELEACEYRCEIGDSLEPLLLPVPVTFDRIRAAPSSGWSAGGQPEVVYSWHDQLEAAGQELTSVVAPADRRVMVEFGDPSAWKDRAGDKIDAIEVASGSSSNRLELMGRSQGDVPPRWVSLPTAGRMCTDRVRVAISGTRHYEAKTFDVKGGRIELTRPYDFRPHWMSYGLLGTGSQFRHMTSNVRSATFGDLGLGFQRELDGLSWFDLAWSLDVEVIGQLTHTLYEGIELPGGPQSDFLPVAYLRFDGRVALEAWYLRRFGFAVAMGGGFGTPLDAGDARVVGITQKSGLVEAQPLIFTMFPGQLWFIVGGGLRLGEQHMNYTTDFTGSPAPIRERDLQAYVFLRLRGALE